MTVAYRAVLIDLDGTLADRAGGVTARTRETLCALQARGVRVMVATGRSVGSALQLLNGLPLNAPAVCYNGAVLYDTARGDWLESRTFPEATVEGLLGSVLTAGVDVLVYAGDRRHTLPSRHEEHGRLMGMLDDVRVVPDAGRLPRKSVNRVSLMGPDDPAMRVIETVRGTFGGSVYLETFPFGTIPGFGGFRSRFCDVQPPCAGKAEGIRYLGERWGIAPAETIAIGDQENDLSMLRAAGLPVAMANASPSVLAASSRVIGHHDEEGVAAFLEEQFRL